MKTSKGFESPSRNDRRAFFDLSRPAMTAVAVLITFGSNMSMLGLPKVGVTRCMAQKVSARPLMVTAKVDKAVEKGLSYLKRTQLRNGSWRANGRYGGGYPTAMTSLAGLAFLSAGHTPTEGKYSQTVKDAIDYILANANRNRGTGLIAKLDEERSCMHGHGFAMLFLAEAYGMERDEKRRRRIRVALERAIRLTATSQSGMGGWLYQPNSGGDEGSVTVTQIQGLRACRNAGIFNTKKYKRVIDNGCKYIEKSQQSDGGIAYRVGQGGSRPPITAAAVAVMYSAGRYEHPTALKALKYVVDLYKRSPSTLLGGHKFYSLFYTSQAMYLSSKENWKNFFPSARDDLLRTQSGDGAWDGDHVGKVYGTAIALVVLQLPHARLPIFQR